MAQLAILKACASFVGKGIMLPCLCRLKRGADASLKDADGHTPLHKAIAQVCRRRCLGNKSESASSSLPCACIPQTCSVCSCSERMCRAMTAQHSCCGYGQEDTVNSQPEQPASDGKHKAYKPKSRAITASVLQPCLCSPADPEAQAHMQHMRGDTMSPLACPHWQSQNFS
jgi:hypothetical protein